MPWCPRCRSEYVPGTQRCADCNDELTDEEPFEPARGSDEDWTLLTTVPLSEAVVLRTALEAAGILVHIDSENAHTFLPLHFGGFSGVPVLVPASDLQRAKKLLQKHNPAPEPPGPA